MATPIILIHGGNCAAACWQDMLPLIRHPVLVVDLPGRGRHPADLTTIRLRDGAMSVIADLDQAQMKRAVFVGHSLGGAMVNELALRFAERAAGLIFVACPFPPQGSCVGAACTPEIHAGFQARRDAGLKTLDVPSREHAATLFGNDMDAPMISRMHTDLVPESLGVFLEPLDLTGLRRGIPSFYIKLTRDAAAPPDIQDQAIAAIRPDKVAEIQSGHMAMYTAPGELAAAIDNWVDMLGDIPSDL